jgi:hypothetical protein
VIKAVRIESAQHLERDPKGPQAAVGPPRIRRTPSRLPVRAATGPPTGRPLPACRLILRAPARTGSVAMTPEDPLIPLAESPVPLSAPAFRGLLALSVPPPYR